MKRSYPTLFAFTVLAAIGLALIARMPHRGGPARRPAASPPAVALAIAIRDGRVSPASAAVPKGHRVRLTVTNLGSAAARVELSGYEDRLAIGTLRPGATWSGEFVADRPGDDFAWLVDGKPGGRFSVAGSHLEEGHR